MTIRITQLKSTEKPFVLLIPYYISFDARARCQKHVVYSTKRIYKFACLKVKALYQTVLNILCVKTFDFFYLLKYL